MLNSWTLATLKAVQRITVAEMMIQGSQPCQAAGAPAARASRALSFVMANSGSGAGRHTLKKSKVTVSEIIDDRMSVRV
jgi:hypothetical protein